EEEEEEEKQEEEEEEQIEEVETEFEVAEKQKQRQKQKHKRKLRQEMEHQSNSRQQRQVQKKAMGKKQIEQEPPFTYNSALTFQTMLRLSEDNENDNYNDNDNDNDNDDGNGNGNGNDNDNDNDNDNNNENNNDNDNYNYNDNGNYNSNENEDDNNNGNNSDNNAVDEDRVVSPKRMPARTIKRSNKPKKSPKWHEEHIEWRDHNQPLKKSTSGDENDHERQVNKYLQRKKNIGFGESQRTNQSDPVDYMDKSNVKKMALYGREDNHYNGILTSTAETEESDNIKLATSVRSNQNMGFQNPYVQTYSSLPPNQSLSDIVRSDNYHGISPPGYQTQTTKMMPERIIAHSHAHSQKEPFRHRDLVNHVYTNSEYFPGSRPFESSIARVNAMDWSSSNNNNNNNNNNITPIFDHKVHKKKLPRDDIDNIDMLPLQESRSLESQQHNRSIYIRKNRDVPVQGQYQPLPISKQSHSGLHPTTTFHRNQNINKTLTKQIKELEAQKKKKKKKKK
ncbi:hypothetical protein RFI_15175, partial [Reticulomyxa filosa]